VSCKELFVGSDDLTSHVQAAVLSKDVEELDSGRLVAKLLCDSLNLQFVKKTAETMDQSGPCK